MGRLDAHGNWYNMVTLVRPFTRDSRDVKKPIVGIGDDREAWMPTASLSGGQRQRGHRPCPFTGSQDFCWRTSLSLPWMGRLPTRL